MSTMTDQERGVLRELRKCHVQGINTLAKGTGLDPARVEGILETLMECGRVIRKVRGSGRVVFAAQRSQA